MINVDPSFTIKALKFYLGIHPTLLGFIFPYGVILSIQIIVAIGQSPDFSKYIGTYFSLIFMLPVSIILIICTAIVSSQLARITQLNIDIEGKAIIIPWGCTYSLMTYIREVFKVLVLLQNFYLEPLGLRKSQIAFILHQVALFSVPFSITVIKRSRYFIGSVDIFSQHLNKIVLTISTVTLFRVIIGSELLVLLVLSPLIYISIYTLTGHLERSRKIQGMLSVIHSRKSSPHDVLMTYLDFMQLLRMIDKDQNDYGMSQSNEGNSSLNHEDQMVLLTLHTQHSRNCLNPSCICSEYSFQCYEQFKLTREQPDAASDKGSDIHQNTSKNDDKYQQQQKKEFQEIKEEDPELEQDGPIYENSNSVSAPNAEEEKSQIKPRFDYAREATTAMAVKRFMANKKSFGSNISQNAAHSGYRKTISKGQGNLISQMVNEENTMITIMSGGSISGGGGTHRENGASQGQLGDMQPNITQLITKICSQNNDKAEADQSVLDKICDEQSELITPQHFKDAILAYGFKNKYEARAYFFRVLIGKIIEEYQGYLQHNISGDLTSSSSIWQDIQILYLMYSVKTLKKPFRVVAQLMKLKYRLSNDEHHKSQFMKMRFRIAEKMLMQEVQEQVDLIKKIYDAEQAIDARGDDAPLDITQYILMSEKQRILDGILESTQGTIKEFWMKWNVPNPKIDKILKIGKKASKLIATVRRVTNEKGFITYSDPKRLSLLIQFYQILVNDMNSAVQIQVTYNSITKFPIKNDDRNGSNNFPLCLVSPEFHGDSLIFKFALVNDPIEKLLRIKKSNLIGRDIKQIMPEGLSHYHDELVKKFFVKGRANQGVFSKKRKIFIKDFNGVLKLVNFRLDFSFNQIFGSYSFIGSFDEITNLSDGFQTGLTLPIENSLFFLTNENFDITDVTQSVLNKCGFEGDIKIYRKLEDHQCRPVNIQQIVPQMQEWIHEKQMQGYSDKSQGVLINKLMPINFYDKMFESFDRKKQELAVINSFSNSQQDLRGETITYYQGFQMIPFKLHPDMENILALPTNAYYAELKAIEESKINRENSGIVELENGILKAEYKGKDFINTNNAGLLNISNEKGSTLMSGVVGFKNVSSSSHVEGEGTKAGSTHFDMSSQASSYSSSVESSSGQAQLIQNLLVHDRSPKILKMVTIIIVIALLAFIGISIYNLIVFLTKHSQIFLRIQAYYHTTKQLINFRVSTIQLQTIHHLSSLPKLTLAQEAMLKNTTRLFLQKKSATDVSMNVVEELNNQNDNFFDFGIIFDNVHFLSDSGTLYMQNMTLKHYQKLFVTYLDQVNFTQLLIEKPPINITNYPYLNATSLSTGSQTMKNLYFLIENGILRMTELALVIIYKIVDMSTNQIETSQNVLNVTTYISVGGISMILVTLIPLLFRLFLNHFQILHFMEQLPQPVVEGQLAKCNEFNQVNERFYLTINQERLNASDQNIGAFDAPGAIDIYQGSRVSWNKRFGKHHKHHMKKHSSKQQDLINDVVPIQAEVDEKQQNTLLVSAKVRNQKKSLFFGKGGKNEKGPIDGVSKNNKGAKSVKQMNHRKKGIFGKNHNKVQIGVWKGQDSKQQDEEEDEEDSSSQKDDESSSKKRRSSDGEDDSESRSQRSNSNQAKNENDKKVDSDQLEAAESQKRMNVGEQIRSESICIKLQVLLVILFCIGYLNSTLFISQYLSSQIFKSNTDSTTKMRIYFKRDLGALNLILAMKQNIIQNRSTTTTVYDAFMKATINDNVNYYQKYCLDAEKDITSIQRDPPSYLLEAMSKLAVYENDQACNTTFKEEWYEKQCENAVEGILLNGIDAAQGYIINQITQLQMMFNTVPPSQRTETFLRDLLYNQKLLAVTDLLVMYMSEMFEQYEQEIVDSIVQFFNKAKQTYMMVFSLIISTTCLWALILGSIVFQRIRKKLTDVQNILILFPLDEIDPELRNKIERYLNF